MDFEKHVVIPSTIDEAWTFLMDVPAVSRCLPGVESVEELGDNVYAGVMNVRVGAVKVKFQGRIEVTERDPVAHRASMRVQGDDKRIGGAMTARIQMQLTERPEGEVDLHVVSEAAVLGKLGELGQAVVLKKADQIMTQFAGNVAQALGGTPEAAAGPPVEAPPPPSPERRGLWPSVRAWFGKLWGGSSE
jgi:carbon monoxide dehydrogenase subunit G